MQGNCFFLNLVSAICSFFPQKTQRRHGQLISQTPILQDLRRSIPQLLGVRCFDWCYRCYRLKEKVGGELKPKGPPKRCLGFTIWTHNHLIFRGHNHPHISWWLKKKPFIFSMGFVCPKALLRGFVLPFQNSLSPNLLLTGMRGSKSTTWWGMGVTVRMADRKFVRIQVLPRRTR